MDKYLPGLGFSLPSMQLGGSISQVPRTQEEEVGVSIDEFAEDRDALKS